MSLLSVHFPHLFLPWLPHFQFLKPLLYYRDPGTLLSQGANFKNAPNSDLLQVRCNYKPPISFYNSDFKDLKVKFVSIFPWKCCNKYNIVWCSGLLWASLKYLSGSLCSNTISHLPFPIALPKFDNPSEFCKSHAKLDILKAAHFNPHATPDSACNL